MDLRNEYENLIISVSGLEYERVVNYLINKLPKLWVNVYKKYSHRSTNICLIQYGLFEYIFDDFSTLVKKGLVPINSKNDSRLVVAYGRSKKMKRKRDDYRLNKWVGPTEKIFGNTWDKGHFIAHYIGGAVDGLELNVFQQKRELNRGWSRDGKIYRKMEEYCFQHPGTFCFNRPIYSDKSSKPSFYEYGVLKSNCDLWVKCFNNQTIIKHNN
ncbi:MAG: hypothetical protein NTU73_08060 [Ignavibacteriae bacterium]|nr:hypothetical protein [Ignavibacteriota bacterium]